MAEKSVHDDAPSAARIHAFFENAVEPILSDNAGLPVAVGALMAAIAGPALLPDSSGHRGLPQGRAIMRETIAALISRWRGNACPIGSLPRIPHRHARTFNTQLHIPRSATGVGGYRQPKAAQ